MKKEVPTSKKIIELYGKMSSGELQTRPYYQRRLVWTSIDKERFIETILKDFPFPEIYICEGEIDAEKLTSIDYVVDGQQRLTTIRDYINGDFIPKKIEPYNMLSKEKKENFLNYVVVVRNLGNIDEKNIKEIFDRLNKTDYSLNSTELIYAQYQGEFISVARKISEKYSSLLDIIIGEKSISRMIDLNFILQIMSTIENGIYFSGDSKVKEFVEIYNESYKNKESMFNLISKSFQFYSDLHLNYDSLFLKKAACFSLITELCLNNLKNDHESVKQRIQSFEKNVLDNKDKDLTDNEFAKFYNYLYQGTASKQARDFRGSLLRKHVFY